MIAAGTVPILRLSMPSAYDGLRRLEYRGYDSAGVAVVHDGTIDLRRSAGKLSKLGEDITETLEVIPRLKLTDQGLVDVERAALVPLWVD